MLKMILCFLIFCLSFGQDFVSDPEYIIVENNESETNSKAPFYLSLGYGLNKLHRYSVDPWSLWGQYIVYYPDVTIGLQLTNRIAIESDFSRTVIKGSLYGTTISVQHLRLFNLAFGFNYRLSSGKVRVEPGMQMIMAIGDYTIGSNREHLTSARGYGINFHFKTSYSVVRHFSIGLKPGIQISRVQVMPLADNASLNAYTIQFFGCFLF